MSRKWGYIRKATPGGGQTVTLWRLQLSLSSPQTNPYLQTLKCLCLWKKECLLKHKCLRFSLFLCFFLVSILLTRVSTSTSRLVSPPKAPDPEEGKTGTHTYISERRTCQHASQRTPSYTCGQENQFFASVQAVMVLELALERSWGTDSYIHTYIHTYMYMNRFWS